MKTLINALKLLMLFTAKAATLRRLASVEAGHRFFRQIMHNHSLTDPQKFYHIATSCNPVSDKVSGLPYEGKKFHYSDHRYQEMYGTFLIPYVRRQRLLKNPIKFFEIGLGCDMRFGMFTVCVFVVFIF